MISLLLHKSEAKLRMSVTIKISYDYCDVTIFFHLSVGFITP